MMARIPVTTEFPLGRGVNAIRAET